MQCHAIFCRIHTFNGSCVWELHVFASVWYENKEENSKRSINLYREKERDREIIYIQWETEKANKTKTRENEYKDVKISEWHLRCSYTHTRFCNKYKLSFEINLIYFPLCMLFVVFAFSLHRLHLNVVQLQAVPFQMIPSFFSRHFNAFNYAKRNRRGWWKWKRKCKHII